MTEEGIKELITDKFEMSIVKITLRVSSSIPLDQIYCTYT